MRSNFLSSGSVCLILYAHFLMECAGLPTYFSNLFNMHKLRPMRSYKIYGSGPHEGPMDFEAGLPTILPPSSFQTPEAMVKQLTSEVLQRNRVSGGSNSNNNVGETSRWSWLVPEYFRQTPSPSNRRYIHAPEYREGILKLENSAKSETFEPTEHLNQIITTTPEPVTQEVPEGDDAENGLNLEDDN